MIKFNFIFLVTALFLFGCEKVINVDLNDANPVIVIEGSLANIPGTATVKISKTRSYFDPEPVEVVTGAEVKIIDESGSEYKFFEEEDGLYLLKNFIHGFNQEYQLSVNVDGTIYESVSTLHEAVIIDSMAIVFNKEYALQNGYNVGIYFHDPPGKDNYYGLKIYLNGELENGSEDFIFFDDININGKFVELCIRRKIFEEGDTVTYELQTLDKAAYNYFDAISELIDGNNVGTAAPANPVPNFTNGALGYFSAYSSDKKTIIIKN